VEDAPRGAQAPDANGLESELPWQAVRTAAHGPIPLMVQERWDRPRAGLDLILDQRGADTSDLPGGAGGILRRDYPKFVTGPSISAILSPV
jgi:hypothetical protein